MMKQNAGDKKSAWPGKRGDIVFYVCLMIFPVIHAVIFYFVKNTQAILMAFQEISIADNSVTWTFTTIKEAFDTMLSPMMLNAALNSLKVYFWSLVIGMPLGLLFSLYIAKKMPGGSAFRFILFLPSIISGLVLVTLFVFFVERWVPSFVGKVFGKKMTGLLENTKTRFFIIIFYHIWAGFGSSALMYANAMSNISTDVVEAAHLDNCEGIKEFWYITLPSIFPTLSTFLVVGVASIFLDQAGLYSIYESSAPPNLYTYGYYLYMKIQTSTSWSQTPVLAAMGLLLTAIAIPMTLIVKYFLEKYGPSEN